MRTLHPRRGGFTLVELIVAVSIMLVLAGMALLIANSGLVGNIRTNSGSDRISGWLMQAREKAKRDAAPRGVRFVPGPDGFIREAQLIEVPEPYVVPASPAGQPPTLLMLEHVAGGNRRAFVVGPNALDVLANVAVGDTLSVPSTGTLHRVRTPGPTAVGGGINGQPAVEIPVVNAALLPDLGAAALAAAPAQPTPTYSTPTFGFIRQPRPTFGEPPLLVPDTMAIDAANSLIPQNPLTGNLDVIFAPTGEVYESGGAGRIVLWTRNPEAFPGNVRAANGGGDRPSYELAGEMRLIVVYSKTGAVMVQPVALPPGPGPNPAHDPYSTTRDGIASGL